MFLFAITGLRTMDPNLVRDFVRETWGDNTTSQYFHDSIQTLEEDACPKATLTIQKFLDSMWITRLDTRSKGATLKPTFNVYANGDIIDNANFWSNMRTHLMERNYYSSQLGQGKAEVNPNHCSLCHGADHPRGLCPFPTIEGWKGPRKKQQVELQKKGINTRNANRNLTGRHY